MNCQRCREHLPMIPGGEADEHTFNELMAHVQSCESCRKEFEKYEFLNSTLGSMRELDDIDFNWERFTTDTAEKILAKTRKPEPIIRSLFSIRNTAAALLAAAALVLFVLGVDIGRTSPEYKPGGEEMAAGTDTESPGLTAVSPEEAALILGQRKLHKPELDIAKDIFPTEEASGAGLYAWIGLTVGNVRSRTSGRMYVMVKEVVAGGPCADAGIKKGDLILSCRGIPVTSVTSMKKSLNSVIPGTAVALEIYQNGERRTLSIVSGKQPLHL